jgi:hypothetical protein
LFHSTIIRPTRCLCRPLHFADAAFAGLDFQLHPVQQASRDEIVQTAAFADDAFTVPARTTAVFVVPQ